MSKPPDTDTGDLNRRLKKSVLDAMFQHCDTFYVHCMPDPDLLIGTRGLVNREKEEGIVLVFGPFSTRQLSWDEQYLHCELHFQKWEQVRIPFECVGRVYDKTGQVLMQWATPIPERSRSKPQDPIAEKRARLLDARAAAIRATEAGDARPRPTDTGGESETEAAPESAGTDAESPPDGSEPAKSRVIEVDFRNRKRD